MAATIANIIVTTADWVSLNALSGIANGTAMTVQNKGNDMIYLQESVAKPAAGNDDGAILSDINRAYAVANVPTGSIEIWARAVSKDTIVSAQLT